VGSVDDFSVTHSTTGFVSVFANATSVAGSTFSMECGVLPEASGTLASDTLTGTFGEDLVPVPQSN
jgi:hypothetical protein